MAPKRVAVMRNPERPRAATGAGCWGLTKQPSGAVISNALKKPLLDWMDSSMRCFMTAYTWDLVYAKLGLMEPLAWGEVPSKSTYTVSPAIFTLAWMAMGCASMPSLSM